MLVPANAAGLGPNRRVEPDDLVRQRTHAFNQFVGKTSDDDHAVNQPLTKYTGLGVSLGQFPGTNQQRGKIGVLKPLVDSQKVLQ